MYLNVCSLLQNPLRKQSQDSLLSLVGWFNFHVCGFHHNQQDTYFREPSHYRPTVPHRHRGEEKTFFSMFIQFFLYIS